MAIVDDATVDVDALEGVAAEYDTLDNEDGPNWHGEGLRVVLKYEQGVTHRRLRDELPLRFQVPPLDEFAREYSHAHSDYDTVKGKQYSTAVSDQLTTVAFDTLQVIDNHPWVVHQRHFGLRHYERVLTEIKRKGSPVRLIAYHRGLQLPEIDMPVTLRTVRVAEKAGEVDARYFSLSFVQWRDAVTERRDRGRWPKYHKLQKRDSLIKLAHKYYGKTRGWRKIGNHNDGLHNWGGRTLIVWHSKYAVGDKIKIPHPPPKKKGGRDRDRGNGSGGISPD